MKRTAVELRTDEDVIVGRLVGDIDFGDTDPITSELLVATPNDALGLVLDLSELRYVDSAGVRMLFELARRLRVCRQRLGIALPEDSPIRRVVKITKLEEIVLLCASVAECVDGLREARG